MNNKKFTQMKFIVILILLCILVRGIGDIFTKEKPVPEIRYEYTTDTIEVPSPTKDPIKGIPTQPKQVIKYLDKPVKDTIAIKELRDSLSLIINGLQSEVWISKQYLRKYQRASKLISMELNRDTLILNMLRINGDILGEKYPIYLSEFDYYYSNNKFSRNPTKLKPSPIPKDPRRRRFNGYTGFGYDIFGKQPVACVGLEIPVRRFSLQLESRLGLLDYDTNSLGLTLKYRIWQK